VRTYEIGSRLVLIRRQEKSLKAGSTVRPVVLVVVKRLVRKVLHTLHVDQLMQLVRRLKTRSTKRGVQLERAGRKRSNYFLVLGLSIALNNGSILGFPAAFQQS
jgi:hypothetical protein